MEVIEQIIDVEYETVAVTKSLGCITGMEDFEKNFCDNTREKQKSIAFIHYRC